MTYPLVTKGLAEEVQDYVGANFLDDDGEPVYEVGDGGNFTLEDAADIQDLENLAGSEILLTLYDEGGTLIPGARRTAQERSLRFAARGATTREALDRAHDLFSWLWDRRSFTTAGFRILILRVSGSPRVSARGASGSYVADFVVTVRAYNSP